MTTTHRLTWTEPARRGRVPSRMAFPHPYPTAARGRAAAALAAALAALVAGCATPAAPTSTAPALGGSAGGGTAVGADSRLQTCSEPVGTVRLHDDMANPTTAAGNAAGVNPNLLALQSMLTSLSALGSRGQSPGDAGNSVSLDALRLLIQQSNCLLIVDRGASEGASDDEKRRARGANEVRDDANMGQGQEVAADYVLRSRVLNLGTTNSSGFNLGVISKLAGGASVNKSVTEATVQLVLSDVRSKVQVAVSQGQGSGANTGLATGALGRLGKLGGAGSFKSESNTSSQTVVLQAFADAYNKLVPAMQNYKPQNVRGGAGAGGTLRVQGSRTDPSAVPK